MRLNIGAQGLVRKQIIPISLRLITFILCCQICESEKIRYASSQDCDRHSLDALYHEKYKLITANIFADSKEFVSRVSDLVADSLTTIMAELPDRDKSNNEEKKIFTQFKSIKSTFASRAKKSQKNITSTWEDLISSHFDLMFDNGKSSLADYENKTIRMTDAYSEARKSLDSTLSAFVGFIKATVRDGLYGIEGAAESAFKKEEEERKKNKTEEKDTQIKDKDEVLLKKKMEITEMIVPSFLGKVTMKVIKNKVDLKKKSSIKPEDRDNPLDDIDFDMKMAKNRIRAIIQLDVPKDKGAVDLARRSIYTYWADQAEDMYRDKIQAKKISNPTEATVTGRLYYRNLWKDEEQLVETLLDLMEVYP